MGTASGHDTSLTSDQQRYLQRIFDYFDEHAEWPTKRYLERGLLKEGLDARALARSLLGRIGDESIGSWNLESKAILTVQDLPLCHDSKPILDAFIQTLRLCVRRYLEDIGEPKITSMDLIASLHMQDALVRKVSLLIENEPGLFKTISSNGIGWEMQIGDVFNFRDVRSIDDYLAKRRKTYLHALPDTYQTFIATQQPIASSIAPSPTPSHEVFIVHGHDEPAREKTARFIEQLGLRPIILHEQANQGLTIIEKFEKHAHVGYAVVLLTPDDVGGPAGDSTGGARPRARQNVILELGFFLGSLGRSNVCALYKGVELPSDMHGVLYVHMDDGGAWKSQLVREFKAAGIEVINAP